MGVLNITPDSFSDGGLYYKPEDAINKAKQHIKSGVDILDIGGQSTRPGANFVSPEEELNRILPIVRTLRKLHPNLILSVDTFHSKVAEEVLNIGVDVINDVTGGRHDPKILDVISASKCTFVITHSRGNSKTMNDFACYKNVGVEVFNELMIQVDKAINAGISSDRIIIDPGLGFAKDNKQNITLLANLEKFTNTKYPVLVGPSRKRFIGHVLNESDPKKRLLGSLAVVCRCVQAKVNIVRVHDIKETSQVINMSNYLWNY